MAKVIIIHLSANQLTYSLNTANYESPKNVLAMQEAMITKLCLKQGKASQLTEHLTWTTEELTKQTNHMHGLNNLKCKNRKIIISFTSVLKVLHIRDLTYVILPG